MAEEARIVHRGWGRYDVLRDGTRLNDTWLLSRPAAERFLKEEAMRRHLEPTPVQPGDSETILLVRRTLTVCHDGARWCYPPGSALPPSAASWVSFRAMLDARSVVYAPRSQISAQPREIETAAPQDEQPKPLSNEEITRLLAKHDIGGDAVSSWRNLIGEISKRLGSSPAAARDRAASHDGCCQLERRAQRLHAERTAGRNFGPARRVIDGLYEGLR
jgi:hypothetical protein